MTHELTPEIANRFAEIALGHVTKEYPHKLDHVLDGPEDVLGPRQLHPIFFGSFDWHSCVHGYWLLLTTLGHYPNMPAARRIRTLLDEMLTEENVAGELAYLDRAYTGGFERPYGWAWVLALHGAAHFYQEDEWADALYPLAQAFADRFKAYLRKLTYPIRVGTHFNTAFAMYHAQDWASVFDDELEIIISEKAQDYFGGDRNCQAWEPGGDEFLSSALMEALCMRYAIRREEDFQSWFEKFLPDLGSMQPATLFAPAVVSDRSDGKIAHLDGLNLSRAWCWRGIAPSLDMRSAALARATADAHLDASLPYVAGDYAGEHWLATFALLALLHSD